MNRENLASVAAIAAVAGAVVGPVGAAEGPKGAIFAGKFEVSGNVIQGVGVEKNGEMSAVISCDDSRIGGGFAVGHVFARRV